METFLKKKRVSDFTERGNPESKGANNFKKNFCRHACIIQKKKRSSYKEHKGNALASGAEEGRDKLRKAAGSGTYAIDPQISEWGNPAGEDPVNIY